MSVVALVVSLFASTLTILVIRVALILKGIHNPHKTNVRRKPLSTLVVLGSGGHTTEMLHMLQQLNPKDYNPLTFVVATTDSTSLRRVEALGGRRPDAVFQIPRSREVGQSYLTSVATTLWSFIFAIGLIVRIRPGLLLCNGPGTCLPLAVMTFVLRVLGLCEGHVVFVESFCRVTRGSTSLG
eukprot:Nitzschia sp. Nitz4//scaffold280_size24494//6758//7378//NITZ4_008390-RA/size24494-augustus-gene-0.13-mRNA-1//-1//CDS//3329545585//8307//frame0